MQLRVITLPWDAENREFSEARLQEATRGLDVLDYESRWTAVDGRECLVLTLKLSGGAAPGSAQPWSGANRARDSRRAEAMEFIRKLEEQMPEANKAAFFKLKGWRSEKVKGTKAPVYSIANNRQLAELALRAPHSLSGIREIDGLGELFCRNYGAEVLSILAGLSPAEFTMPEKSGDEEGPSMTNVSEEDNTTSKNQSTRTREERRGQ